MTRSLMNPFASNGLISASRGLRSLAAINVTADAGPGARSTLYTYIYAGENNAKSSRQAAMRNQISAAIFYGNGQKYKSNSHRGRNTAAGQSKQQLSRNVSCMIRKTNTHTHKHTCE